MYCLNCGSAYSGVLLLVGIIFVIGGFTLLTGGHDPIGSLTFLMVGVVIVVVIVLIFEKNKCHTKKLR